MSFFTHKGIRVDFQDITGSQAGLWVSDEIKRGHYDLDIPFQKGDIMVDIGAHIGLVSIFYAKMYPELIIYAFEPFPGNYKLLMENIEKNQVKNIIAFPFAILEKGRNSFKMVQGCDNSGGATGCLFKLDLEGHRRATVEAKDLLQVCVENNIKRIKLLKVDCEGSEHFILHNHDFKKVPIENVIGEFHINDYLKSRGFSIQSLKSMLEKQNIKHKIQECEMANV